MRKIIRRQFRLDLAPGKSAFLWGPRKVGKSWWIAHELPQAPVIDLLKTEVYAEYAAKPSLLRERFAARRDLVVIDEVQKVPTLLDEVHWLIEHGGPAFLLTGSSARKLRREHANLLGGRAWRRSLAPLSASEVEGFEWSHVMEAGLLPPHFLSPRPQEDLRSYVADYLKEEVAAEAMTRDIPAFAEFLRVAAQTSSELLNYANVAREAGVSARAVRSYFDMLEDALLGFRLAPWRRSPSRRMILTEKFYLFDVGVANHLARRRPAPGTPDFGKAFEHWVLMELKAFQAYRRPDLPLSFWRTSTGQEVDFILGDKELAIEAKGKPRVHDADLAPMAVLAEEGPVRRRVVVCLEREPRRSAGGVEVLPWRAFVDRLWAGELI